MLQRSALTYWEKGSIRMPDKYLLFVDKTKRKPSTESLDLSWSLLLTCSHAFSASCNWILSLVPSNPGHAYWSQWESLTFPAERERDGPICNYCKDASL